MAGLNHIGQDWRQKHLAFVLETKLMWEKANRDTFLNYLSDAVIRCDEPLAKTLPNQQFFQRKMTTWKYNQHGMQTKYMETFPWVDHHYAYRGVIGTREWVPYVNMHQNSVATQVREGLMFCHRVPIRGYGTCLHLQKGGWKHRWNKTLERNVLHLTRA